MITHCPECKIPLVGYNPDRLNYNHLICYNISYPSLYHYHYSVAYDKGILTFKVRIIKINDKPFIFVTNKLIPAITVAPLGKPFIFNMKEFMGEVDEVEFTKRIIRMKVFI